MPAPVTRSPQLRPSPPMLPAPVETPAPEPTPQSLIVTTADESVEQTLTIIRALTNQHNALVAKSAEDPTALRDAKVLKKAAEIVLARSFTPTLS